jgi:hypothetical protein
VEVVPLATTSGAVRRNDARAARDFPAVGRRGAG